MGYAQTLPLRLIPRRERESSAELSPWSNYLMMPVYAAQTDHFLNCTIEGGQLVCDGQQDLRDIIIQEAAHRSPRERTAVSLGPNVADFDAALSTWNWSWSIRFLFLRTCADYDS